MKAKPKKKLAKRAPAKKARPANDRRVAKVMGDAMEQAASHAIASIFAADDRRRLEASALLMREIVCEQIYRQRDAWDIEHPNNSLGVRAIHPHDVARAAVAEIVDMSAKHLRQLAAAILNEQDTNAWPEVVTRFFMVGQ